MSLFKSFNPSSLFQVVNLDVIQRVSLEYKNTFCFDIIINKIHRNQFTSGPLSLCAKSLIDMRDWINAILEFKECNINVKAACDWLAISIKLMCCFRVKQSIPIYTLLHVSFLLLPFKLHIRASEEIFCSMKLIE